MEDEEILDLLFARDERALKETERKYGRLCYNIAYNILNDHEDADECVNDALAGLWNAVPPARPVNLMAFLCGITRNLALKRLEYLKREKRSAAVTVSLDELSEILPDDRIPDSFADDDIGRLISAFLRAQKEDARNVFIRKYYFFDPVADIAKRYSFTESKVKNMLLATRKKLKNYLLKEGVEL